MNVYLPWWLATQWPCPSGFHIPTYSEFSALMTKTTTIWLGTGTGKMTYLKLPTAWLRSVGSGDTTQQGSTWYYYCSDKYYYNISTSWTGSWSISYTAIWYSVRPFKDTPVVPDSNWTVLYQWTWTAWIYHNSTLWIISISSDWENRQTIADKNLWATTVYNYWDTLSQNNCGNYYQRGNCYWFPRIWSITTSWTQVNAGSYWPSNPYYSSTYITRSASPYDWDSSNNANLRWWEDGNVQVMSELKNAYIGEAPYEWDELCFTANTAGSTIKLHKSWSPVSVTIEYSMNRTSWSTYTFGTQLSLSRVWDKVYFRNASTTTTWLNTSSAYYQFIMTWSISASWDVNYLINKNSTSSLTWEFCYRLLFYNCTALTTAPRLPALNLTLRCYLNMFYWCTNLTNLPTLNATNLTEACYQQMFYGCSKIKLSTTQTWEYQTAYRVPNVWTGILGTNSLNSMFYQTWWTFTWTPSINTTYYTSNTVV